MDRNNDCTAKRLTHLLSQYEKTLCNFLNLFGLVIILLIGTIVTWRIVEEVKAYNKTLLQQSTQTKSPKTITIGLPGADNKIYHSYIQFNCNFGTRLLQ